MKIIKTDLCILGGGSGGLSVAAGAVQMGARVVLCEADKMGGDCLNNGCVPSKALLAAAKRAEAVRTAKAFGLNAHIDSIDYGAVSDHVTSVVDSIAPHDSVERFEKLGCTVIQSAGKFIDAHTVQAGDTQIRAKKFVIATGSRAAIPPIDGLADTPYLTNETIFDLREQPSHLIIIGGGPIGCEMAQAHHLLGTKVTLLEAFTILPKDNPELTTRLKQQLNDDGISLNENVKINTVHYDHGFHINYEVDGETKTLTGSHCLVAAGRTPNIESLHLDAANIKYHPRGIVTDKRLRTSNKKVFAIGDVAGPYQFTHMAGYQAGIVIRNALFKLPAKVAYHAVPWCTYTEPELAHVGMMEAEANKAGAKTLSLDFTDNDRATAERQTQGHIKVYVTKKGKILGASILGPNAGELISTWTLAIQHGIKIGAIAGTIFPYPTVSEINKRIAGQFYTPALFSTRTRRMVRFLLRF